MLIPIILAIILGIIAGTLTGLIPGIHINLVAVILLGISASLLNITSPLVIAVFIISMAITHTFLDFIPSIFLGAPDEDSILSILPGHQLLLKGKAYQAVVLTLYGSLTALIIILIFTPLFLYGLPIIYPYIQRIMWIILILVSAYLIYYEKDKRLQALVIFILAGFLGIASLNINIKEPLLPLLTGLFGASNILISINKNTQPPPQKIIPLKKIRLSRKSITKSSLASIIASPFTAFLPGLGASQSALIGKEVLGDKSLNQNEFLFLLGAINTIVMGLSFITFYSIQKTRTGAAVAISRLLPQLSMSNLFLFITVMFISGIASFFITIGISKIASKKIHKVSYKKLSIIILIILTIITIIFSDMFNIIGGLIGLLIFIISVSLGIFTILTGVRRIHLMGCLLIPTILFYLL